MNKQEVLTNYQSNTGNNTPHNPEPESSRVPIFVHGLHPDSTKQDLLDIFEPVCKVSQLQLNRDKRTGRHKGYAFFEVETMDDARRLVNGSHYLHGRNIHCDFKKGSQREKRIGGDNKRVFVGGLSQGTTDEQMRLAFLKFGDIRAAYTIKDMKGKSKRFGYVDFVEDTAAANAAKRKNIMIDGKKIDIKRFKRKEPRGKRDRRIKNNNNNKGGLAQVGAPDQSNNLGMSTVTRKSELPEGGKASVQRPKATKGYQNQVTNKKKHLSSVFYPSGFTQDDQMLLGELQNNTGNPKTQQQQQILAQMIKMFQAGAMLNQTHKRHRAAAGSIPSLEDLKLDFSHRVTQGQKPINIPYPTFDSVPTTGNLDMETVTPINQSLLSNIANLGQKWQIKGEKNMQNPRKIDLEFDRSQSRSTLNEVIATSKVIKRCEGFRSCYVFRKVTYKTWKKNLRRRLRSKNR